MRKFYSKQKIRNFWFISIILFCLVVFGLWQYSQLQDQSVNYQIKQPLAVTNSNEPIRPLPVKLELDEAEVKLGEKLFQDPRLSGNNKLSCASCHNLKIGGTDHLVVSVGINNNTGFVNSPTVFNSGFNFKQFWDGRAKTLEEQIDGPIHSKHEMDSNWQDIINKLKQSPEYVSMFKALYSSEINSNNIKNAIATFERSLITPNSRFDQFLNGNKNALTPEEKEGYYHFKAYGCVTCHQGINMGGNMFQGLGVFGNYFQDRGNETKADLGRYNVTGDESDRYVFKVPSLRNIVLTAPYFHDGSVKTLEEAVKKMSKYQLGRPLSSKDTDLIIKFLNTLTGEYKGEPL